MTADRGFIIFVDFVGRFQCRLQWFCRDSPGCEAECTQIRSTPIDVFLVLDLTLSDRALLILSDVFKQVLHLTKGSLDLLIELFRYVVAARGCSRFCERLLGEIRFTFCTRQWLYCSLRHWTPCSHLNLGHRDYETVKQLLISNFQVKMSDEL